MKYRCFSGGPSQGQEIDGEAGENPARYRHCDSGPRERDGQPDCQPEGVFKHPRITDIEIERMLYQSMPLRGSRRSAHALLALLAAISVRAEERKAEFEPLIISALRVPRDAAVVTSAVTLLDPEALQDQGIFQLRDALNAVPGVISISTGGQTGAIGSLLIRGTTTNYSQVVVDGMRLSDSTTPLGNILSASRVNDVGSIEVLRGPQGAIYGGESIGGVLWLETPRGSGDPHGTSRIEGGAFHSLATHSTFQGETRGLSYFLSGGYEETENDGPHEAFHQGNTSLRLEGKVDEVWTIGSTFRGLDNFYDDHGNSDNRVDSELATAYATGRISDCWTTRFHAGYQQEFYDNDSEYGNYGADIRAGSISCDHEIVLAETLRLLAGMYGHQSAFKNTIETADSRDRYGIHTALEWNIGADLTTTAAVRWEDYDAYGDEFTWRFGSIYKIHGADTSLRSGIGTSFRSPSYLDLFGSTYGGGNPDLVAESSLGWDLGLEQKIGSHHTVEITGFRNKITDRIQSYPTPPINIPGESTTGGLEIGLRGSGLEESLGYRVAWTYLHKSLSDQPRNAATASVDWKPTGSSLVGIGATHLSDHSWGGDSLESYTILRIYSYYQISSRTKIHLRLENALDKSHELASFSGSAIKGPGAGLYGGLTLDW